MGESLVQVTEGAGKNLHTWARTVAAVVREDEFTVPGEYPLPTWSAPFFGVSIATANDHILSIQAGASLHVRIRAIYVRQSSLASAASAAEIQVLRVTTAPTGGTTVTSAAHDTADGAPGATVRTLPTTKGTEGAVIKRFLLDCVAARPIAPAQIDWVQLPGVKPIIIPAGTTNALAIKTLSGIATAAVAGYVEFVETAYL